MKNINIIYDNYIDIWSLGCFRSISLISSNFISYDKESQTYNYSQLNLTGRIIDLRTSS